MSQGIKFGEDKGKFANIWANSPEQSEQGPAVEAETDAATQTAG